MGHALLPATPTSVVKCMNFLGLIILMSIIQPDDSQKFDEWGSSLTQFSDEISLSILKHRQT